MPVDLRAAVVIGARRDRKPAAAGAGRVKGGPLHERGALIDPRPKRGCNSCLVQGCRSVQVRTKASCYIHRAAEVRGVQDFPWTGSSTPANQGWLSRRSPLVRSSELELHARARELFERENLGRLWRTPVGAPANSPASQTAASLVERQNYLVRIRAQMRDEGAMIVTEEESLSRALGGRNYVLPQR